MVNLSEEIGEDIQIMQDSIYGTEQLIAMVAAERSATQSVMKNTAKVNQIYYPDLVVETPVSFSPKTCLGSEARRTGMAELPGQLDPQFQGK